MEAIAFTLKDKKVELVHKPIPKIQNDKDVLVKVAYSGVCGTDLHILAGEYPCNRDRPITLGHEFSGTVVDVGPAVSAVKKGDTVSVDPNCSCEVCRACHSGEPNYCILSSTTDVIGVFSDGGWAEYTLVPEKQVYKLPEGMTLDKAVLAEPLSCLAHGWDRISPVTVGQRILITGAGIIGNLWAALFHLQGHRRVTISEPNSARRALVQKLDTGFDCISPDILKQRQADDPDYLFDVIVDCSGFPPAVEHAFSLLNDGGKLCLFGIAPAHSKISIAPFQMYMKEAKIIGIKINPFTFPKALGLLESLGDRYLDYNKLGIRVFSLKEYKEALECLRKGTIAKAVFKL